MNDPVIRDSFHKRRLTTHHENPQTLVVDELGLKHGQCRADIAVINGRMIGYEIKSDKDSLDRLEDQVSAYDEIFDYSHVIVGEKYKEVISKHIPNWWGIIFCKMGARGAVFFSTERRPKRNPNISALSTAKLLWRDEAAPIAESLGAPRKLLRAPRECIYEFIASHMSAKILADTVRQTLKHRPNWRCPE